MASSVNPNQTEEIYEPQYHPKAELGNIFGQRKNKVLDFDSIIEHNTNASQASPDIADDNLQVNDDEYVNTH